MKINLKHKGQKYRVNLSKPIDISIPIKNGMENPNCFYAPMPEFEPVRAGDFVGSTKEGGGVNFFNIKFNPHGNGTHTECVGHISKKRYLINDSLTSFHHFVKLVSVIPMKQENGDRVITKAQMEAVFSKNETPAIAIRTQPNDDLKRTTNYSAANPPYIHHEAIEYLVECGVEHLLVDLPSVDKEEDGGKLLAHKAFWKYPDIVRKSSTITELFYASNEIKDGLYLLGLHIISLELDVSPSKPVLYKLTKK